VASLPLVLLLYERFVPDLHLNAPESGEAARLGEVWVLDEASVCSLV
jgi:hypothetical protein